jgi:L-threonylcarbamoyladenylate synthase
LSSTSYTKDIHKALETLIKGGTILYPTDTIWGIGCDGTNETAVHKVYKLKKRADTKSMLVLVKDIDMISDYVKNIPDAVSNISSSENKPLTIIYPAAKNLAPNLIAEDGSIGIRIVRDPFCLRLISEFNKPIVSTSANISGKLSPKKFSEVDAELINKVDYVVRWKQDDTSQQQPSGIIKIGINGEIEVIRE